MISARTPAPSRPRSKAIERERGGADRADAGGQAVDAVGEVDGVHDRDEAEQGQRLRRGRRTRRRPTNGSVNDSTATPASTSTSAASSWPASFHAAGSVAPVVDRADERDERGAAEDRLPLVVLRSGRNSEPGDRGAGEDRQPAEQRRRLVGEPARARLVDRAELRGEPGDQRRERRRRRRTRRAGRGGRRRPCRRLFGRPRRTPARARASDGGGRPQVRVERVAVGDRRDALGELGLRGRRTPGVSAVAMMLADLGEVLDLQAAGGERRGADAQAAR